MFLNKKFIYNIKINSKDISFTKTRSNVITYSYYKHTLLELEENISTHLNINEVENINKFKLNIEKNEDSL